MLQNTSYDNTEYEKYHTYDNVYHWKICLKKIGAKTCGYVYEKQVHNFGQWSVPGSNGGRMTRSCLTCFYKQERYATEEELSKYQLQTTNAKILINGKANQGDFANAGDTITLIADYSTDIDHIFGGWSVWHYWDDEGHSHLSLDLTDAEKKNPTLTFTMPAHKVDVRGVVKVCHHDDVTKQHPDESTAVPASCFTAGKKADLICDLCRGVVKKGEMVPAYGGHDYQLDDSTVSESTCTKVGFTGNMVCTHCGDTIRGERVAKLEHTYGETEVITAPTCHSLGLEGKICSGCGYILRGDRIAKTGHTESDWIIDTYGHMTKCTDPDCGAQMEKKTAHTDANEDGKCDVCGYVLYAPAAYTVTFEMNGHGNPVEDQTVPEGTKAATPSDPAASGWTFDGWYADAAFSAAFDFDTAIIADTTVYAKWTEIITPPAPEYSIISEADSEWTMGSTTGLAITSDAPFAKFVGVEVDGAALAAVYYTAEEGSTRITLTPAYLETLSVGTHSIEIVSSDGSVSATFTVKEAVLPPAPITYEVKFNMGGHGTAPADQIVNEGSKAAKPAAEPAAEGWTFDGWYADAAFSAKFDFDTAIHANTEIFAKWTEIPAAPTDPTDPADPIDPTEPTEPTEPTDPVGPQTGDNSDMFLWIALLLISGGALVGTTVYGKKRKRAE